MKNMRFFLHAAGSSCDTIVIAAKGTDILIMSLCNLDKMQCKHTCGWIRENRGSRWFIPIHVIHIAKCFLKFWHHPGQRETTSSYILVHAQRLLWNTFADNPQALQVLGKGTILKKLSIRSKFFGFDYKLNAYSVDDARTLLFGQK